VIEGVLRVRALEQAVRSSETALQSTRRSYEAGSRTQVDVLNAEEARVSAVLDLANARYAYLLARITLRALAGEADAERLLKRTDGCRERHGSDGQARVRRDARHKGERQWKTQDPMKADRAFSRRRAMRWSGGEPPPASARQRRSGSCSRTRGPWCSARWPN
jgi:hypothetical protein